MDIYLQDMQIATVWKEDGDIIMRNQCYVLSCKRWAVQMIMGPRLQGHTFPAEYGVNSQETRDMLKVVSGTFNLLLRLGLSRCTNSFTARLFHFRMYPAENSLMFLRKLRATSPNENQNKIKQKQKKLHLPNCLTHTSSAQPDGWLYNNDLI